MTKKTESTKINRTCHSCLFLLNRFTMKTLNEAQNKTSAIIKIPATTGPNLNISPLRHPFTCSQTSASLGPSISGGLLINIYPPGSSTFFT